jgi:hypothetical protein
LEPFTDPNCVFAYGFGDAVSQAVAVFNLLEVEDSPCIDYKQGGTGVNAMILEIFSPGKLGQK